MAFFVLYWRGSGDAEVVEGSDIADACNKAGYGAGAISALDFYQEGRVQYYYWNKTEWKRCENETSLALLKFYDGDPNRWTTGAYARDENKQKISPTGLRATCWCLLGAYEKCEQDAGPLTGFFTLFFETHQASLTWFNDHHTYEQVMDALRRMPK